MKTDRSILAANDQSMGQFGDPDKLESSITHLADTIDSNDTDISVLKTDNTSNKGRLNTLEGDVSTLKTDNTSNKSRITENENDIAYTDARVTDILRNNPQPSEVVDARLGFPVLRNKLESIDSQLAETEKKQSHFSRYQLEKAGEPHQDGLSYTGFFSGCIYKGQEIHVGRSGGGHVGNDAVLVAYIRNDDGTFTRKKIGGVLDYSLGDFREPRINYSPTTGKLSIWITIKKIDGTYSNYYSELNDQFDVANFYKCPAMDGKYTFGNSIASIDNFTLRTAYDSGAQGGVSLYKSSTISGGDVVYNKLLDLFPPSVNIPTECTIAQWGDRLIAITRQNNGNMLYRQTYDLTGATGWGNIIDLGFTGDAPVLLPYTPKKEPIILGRSVGIPGYGRSPVFNISYDGSTWSQTYFLDKLLIHGGGYQSLVPNRNGFGSMYYQDGSDPTLAAATTDVYYKEFDLMKLLYKEDSIVNFSNNTQSFVLNIFRNNEVVSGDCTFVDSLFSSSSSLTELSFEVKKSFSIKAIELLLSNNGTITCALNLYENGTLIATTPTLSVSTLTKTIYTFNLPSVTTLNLGSVYKIILTANVRNYSKNFIVPYGKVDFGDFVYLTTIHNGANMNKNVIPFGLVKNI